MSDVLEKIKTRRSVKKYKPDMIPQDIIDKVTEAGKKDLTHFMVRLPF